jgi:hypothetical protein
MRLLALALLILSACGGTTSSHGGQSPDSGGSSAGDGSTPVVSGESRYLDALHTGNFWIGPVEYAGSLHNACAPSNGDPTIYPAGIQQLYGPYIMGLANEVQLHGLTASEGGLCDACVELEANGKKLIAHAVTYGVETGPNDIDVSPSIDSALGLSAGRTGTWRFITCPTTSPVVYTFDSGEWPDNTWYFRVWPRNARLPVTRVEYRVGSGSWTPAQAQGDGAWQASGTDFSGGFSLRLNSLDGQTLEDALPGIGTFDPNVGKASHGNFE